MRLPIIKYRNLWFLFAAILISSCVAILFLFPLRFGIDFTGGSLMEVEFSGERPAPTDVSGLVADLGLGESVAQTIGDKGMLIRSKTLDEPTHQEVSAALAERFGEISERRFESVGPTVGDELRSKAVWSITLVLVGIALYVAFAFRKVSRPVSSWKYALTTIIVGLLHDVLIPLAALALLGRLAFAEVNSAFIASILTVLGFSMHDKIVVFDRVRENLLRTGGAFEEVVERSVNETITRSIIDSLTAFLPLIAVYVWGGDTLKTFAFTMMIGIAVGVYSSVFLAAPLLVVFQKRSSR